MIITNITDRAGNAPKVIGIGNYWLMPGDEKQIPDTIAYIDEVNEYGNKTGKKVVLPSIAVQAGLGLLKYEETKKTESPKVEETKVEEHVEGKPVETAEPEKPQTTRGRKKAEKTE